MISSHFSGVRKNLINFLLTSWRNTRKYQPTALSVHYTRTLISLYEELVLTGIIKKPTKVQINEYYGEYSFLGTTLRQANIEPQPSLSDIRRLITEYAILPLGKVQIHFCLWSS